MGKRSLNNYSCGFLLKMPDDIDKDVLSAHGYFVPGLLVNYSTDAFDGVQFGCDWYPDTDFEDFKLGKKTLASVDLGYTNPVKPTLDLERGQDPSSTFNSRWDTQLRRGDTAGADRLAGVQRRAGDLHRWQSVAVGRGRQRVDGGFPAAEEPAIP